MKIQALLIVFALVLTLVLCAPAARAEPGHEAAIRAGLLSSQFSYGI
ncbi:MAG: hypothetical protein PQ964_08435 [Methanobacteriaceae archaeon]